MTAGAVKPVRNEGLKCMSMYTCGDQVPLRQSAVGHCSVDLTCTPSMPVHALAVALLRSTDLLLRPRDQTGQTGLAST